jgi:hypothetical protein
MNGQQPGKGFAMVPAWLAWKKPSANALLVYVHLALFGTFNPGTATYEQCRPSKRTLAEGDPKRGYPGTGLGEQTVGRALRELESLGAIKGEPSYHPKTRAQGPTVYRLVFGQVVEDETAGQTPVSQVIPPRDGGKETAGQDPISPVTPSPGISPDMGGISTAVPGPGITSDTQPRTSFDLEPCTKKTPPTPREPATAAVDDQAVTQGGSILDEETRNILNTAVDRAVTERAGAAGWTAGKVRAAVREQLDAGATAAEVVAGLAAAAADVEGTAYPGRLAWWVTERRRQAAAAATPGPAWAEGPFRHLAPGTPMCRTHQGEPAHNCNRCAAERAGADDGTEARLLAERLDAASARELARRNAAAKRTARPGVAGRREQARHDFGATLARLDAELAKLHGPAGDDQAPAELAAAS